MKTKYINKKGMAGIIVVVLIMALLMSVSISYLKMMEVEGQVQEMSDSSERALDAAFAGISYAMAIAQGTKDMFKGESYLKHRPYLVENPTETGNFAVGLNKDDLTRRIESVWLYLDETMALIDEEETRPPYRFRATSYPCIVKDDDGNSSIEPNRYMVKSQGNFMYYESGTDDVIATFTSQIVAELFVASPSRRLYLRRYRTVPYQKGDSFFRRLTQLPQY